MNTTMMNTILTQPDDYSVEEVDRFFEGIFAELVIEHSKISQFKGQINAKKNP